ncbi:MAG TPA: type IVB secretion system lipoprotein DotD, partial [Gammaproteobacteria bacterium]|nr:type IVB secretion system lipoprotein DotD [Gammaproteobacteria bacterium]
NIPTVSESLNVDQQLSSAAYSVQESLHALAAAKEPHELNAINTELLVTPEGGMGNPVTIDWSGPLEPLLYRLGGLSHYSVKVLGPSPAIPIIVTMHVENRRVADILKDAGLQAGNRANIVVYPESKIIELRYVPT